MVGLSGAFGSLITRLAIIKDTRGPAAFVLYIKGTRTALLNYLAGTSIRVKGVSTYSDGIPKVLKDFVPYLRDNPSPQLVRMLLTILYSTRSLKVRRSPRCKSYY